MSDPTPPENPYDPSAGQGPNPYDPNAGQSPTPYGQPAYGEQPAYGGQPAYGQPYGQPAYGLPSTAYASWGKRVVAYLIDYLVVSIAGFPAWIGYFMGISTVVGDATVDPVTGELQNAGSFSGVSIALILVGGALSIAAFVWNTCIKGGGTGYSIGKGAMGIRLIGERTGQPIGAGMAFVRQLAHVIDSLPCDIGYLWPLWDPKRQTFADKIMSTVVIEQPKV
jgi:uncharacterized RDD family membrane protein YckC